MYSPVTTVPKKKRRNSHALKDWSIGNAAKVPPVNTIQTIRDFRVPNRFTSPGAKGLPSTIPSGVIAPLRPIMFSLQPAA